MFDHTSVLTNDVLNDLEIFHRDQRLHIGRVLPFDDFALIKVNMTVIHIAVGSDNHYVGNTAWFLSMVRVCQPLQHSSLGRLEQSDGIVVQLAIL